MSKVQLIEAIRSHNRSAKPDFLINFDKNELAIYLSHLEQTSRPRGQNSAWIRPGETHSIVARIH